MSLRGSESRSNVSGVYDPARRRRSVRRGRERGCWVYIPAAVLREIGVELERERPPLYRIFAGRRRSLAVTLYKQEPREE
jgi:hypothetical protein